MNIRLKKTIGIASIALISTMAFVGCTNNNDSNAKPSTSESSTVKVDKKAASDFLNQYYTDMIKNAETSSENSKQIETVMKEVIGEDEYAKVAESGDPFSALDGLDKDKQKELADKLQALNPLASYYDYSGMSDTDRVYLNLLTIASSSLLASGELPEDYTVNVSIPEDKIAVKENKATIKFSDIQFTINGNTSDQASDPTGASDLHLVYIDNAWKIDGKSTFKTIKESYNDIGSASDGGGASDNGE